MPTLSRLFILFFILVSSRAIAAPINQNTILSEINSYRITHGLSALKINSVISKEAQQHSRDMASHTISFSHAGYENRARNLFNYFGVGGFAENVAYMDAGAHGLVNLWLRSPGHRKNIEGEYDLTGIGIAYDAHGRIYVTQIFLRTTIG